MSNRLGGDRLAPVSDYRIRGIGSVPDGISRMYPVAERISNLPLGCNQTFSV